MRRTSNIYRALIMATSFAGIMLIRKIPASSDLIIALALPTVIFLAFLFRSARKKEGNPIPSSGFLLPVGLLALVAVLYLIYN